RQCHPADHDALSRSNRDHAPRRRNGAHHSRPVPRRGTAAGHPRLASGPHPPVHGVPRRPQIASARERAGVEFSVQWIFAVAKNRGADRGRNDRRLLRQLAFGAREWRGAGVKLVECVPNISEGRRPEVYEAVAAAAAVPGITLLNIDPGFETNRTVITFVGGPDAVVEGAFQLIRKGYELIDMSKHRGAHPRIGA